jgi:hypothetical protein
MQRLIRAAAGCALLASLAACIVQQPQAASPFPHEAAMRRLGEVNSRIDHLSHLVDVHVNQGYYPPPQGGALHHRLDVIRQEARDMSAARAGGLSGEEQHTLNQELDGTARAIGQ